MSSDWQDPLQESVIYETCSVMESRLVDIKVHLGGSVEDGGEQNAIYANEQVLVSFPVYFQKPRAVRKMIAVQKVDDYFDWSQAVKVYRPGYAWRSGQVLVSPPRVRQVPKQLAPEHVVGLGMRIETNAKLNKVVVADLAAEGGAYQSRQIEKGDVILGVASTPGAPIRAAQTLDQVHDWLLGAEGTQVVLQIQKANGLLLTVTCTRIRVENSTNPALHDHSMDPNRGALNYKP